MKIIFKGAPLSTQSIYRCTCLGKFARLYMTKKGKQLKEKYQWEIKSQYKGKIFEGDCRVKITLFFKRKGIADIDNFNKLVIDSLQGIILKNDSQIQELLIKKDYSKENPRIEIELLKIKKLEKELK